MLIHRHSIIVLLMIFLVVFSIPSRARPESSVERWLRVLGISVTPQTKGPGDEIEDGDIWLATASADVTPQRLTRNGGYRSPIFFPEDKVVLALRANSLVRISASGGEPETVMAVKGITKLIGIAVSKPDDVLVLNQDVDGRASVAILSLKERRITPISGETTASEDRRIINSLNGWDRAYPDLTLTVGITREQGLGGKKTWSDVYMMRNGQPKQNISQCQEVNCGQPALSHDGTRVLFVKMRDR